MDLMGLTAKLTSPDQRWASTACFCQRGNDHSGCIRNILQLQDLTTNFSINKEHHGGSLFTRQNWKLGLQMFRSAIERSCGDYITLHYVTVSCSGSCELDS
jgi:hypothetical protein